MNDDFDPITYEVLKNGLASIADEMALVIMRSAYSPVVRDSMDYSTALCDKDGQIVAQGLTLAVQLGAFPDAMKYVIEAAKDAKPGDIFIANDPYGAGGQHLPDLYVIKPIFIDERIEGYACTMAHHSDIGGIAPGSIAIHATEIYQEGLRLPLVKLYVEGKPNQTVFSIIEKNTRLPTQVVGDLRAQVAACTVGERGLTQLHLRHGGDIFRQYLVRLQDQAAAMMRSFISEIPDGCYTFEDYIDGVGEQPVPIVIKVAVTVSGSDIIVDFSGTAQQIQAAINCPVAMVNSATYCAIRCITSPDIPNVQGYMRPVQIRVPVGSILNPTEPAACAARGVMGYRVFDVIMGAMAQALPQKVIAGCEGGPTLLAIGGTHEGHPFVLTEVMVGTWGARYNTDGLEGVSNPAANLSNQPIELIEAELPLRITGYGLVPDSGGPGEFRGGLAFFRSFEVLAKDAVFTTRSDRRDHRPYGLSGGKPGSGSNNILVRKGVEATLPTMPMEAIQVHYGDMLHHTAAGGGGFGDPYKRDPASVLEDVIDGKLSSAAAFRDYRVAIDISSQIVDVQKTSAARAQGKEHV